VGFTITPQKAAVVRSQRRIHVSLSDYTDPESIRRELRFCHKIFRRINGLQIVDVTNSSIEEIADKILARL
jgi:regulator of PEP synthase PpsR (kinase-PPPase family)